MRYHHNICKIIRRMYSDVINPHVLLSAVIVLTEITLICHLCVVIEGFYRDDVEIPVHDIGKVCPLKI